ncbi:MAG TPA: isocitrate/isopropylmalate family dehydrogenase, partial [Trueperaceae bacterium]
MANYRLAVIPGDGIGKEVVAVGLEVLDAVAASNGLSVATQTLPWGCEFYRQTGRMMPEDALERLAEHDAIFLGAIGSPGVPDHVSLWGLLIPIRRHFQQYVNLRPVRLLPGIPSPLAANPPIDF